MRPFTSLLVLAAVSLLAATSIASVIPTQQPESDIDSTKPPATLEEDTANFHVAASTANFWSTTETASASRLVVAYFSASWCNPCKRFSPHFYTFAASNPLFYFIKVQVSDDMEALRKELGIDIYPTVGIFKGRKMLSMLQSPSITALEETLKSVQEEDKVKEEDKAKEDTPDTVAASGAA